MIVYALEICWCEFETGYSVFSLHAAKEGAWKAGRRFITQRVEQNYRIRERIGKTRGDVWEVGPHVDGWRVRAWDVEAAAPAGSQV